MNKNGNNIIYKITNKVNGKVYIGLTSRGLRLRESDHKSRLVAGERDHKIYMAMRKYGFDNFKFEAICTALDESYLPELEIEFINEYDSFNHGYNMNIGGTIVSDETREKLRKIFTGRKITWYDKILESRFANSDRKDPRDYVARGKHNSNSKRYLVMKPNGQPVIVHGLNDFCRVNNLDAPTMHATLSGKQNFHHGYRLIARFNDYPETEYDGSYCHRKWAASNNVDGDIV